MLVFVLYFIIKESFSLSNSLILYSIINFYIINLKNIIESYPNYVFFKNYINKTNEFLSFNEFESNILKIHFEKISIKYLYYKINNKVIINNLNYSFKLGDKIFIKGPSGTGKSTLMKILNNEIKRYNGNILLDGKDIKKFNLNNLITYVSQNETLFNDTIYNNLCLGKNIDEDLLSNILKICRLNEFSDR